MKQCRKCLSAYELNGFFRKKNGCKNGYASMCKKCCRSNRDRIIGFVNELKNVPCADCGGRFPSVCMQFDHREPEKKNFEIGDACSQYNDFLYEHQFVRICARLKKEADTCDVVCANCHAVRTHTKGQSVNHRYKTEIVFEVVALRNPQIPLSWISDAMVA